MLAAVKRDVRRHGLPELRAAFRRLGIPDSEIAPVTQAILGMSIRELRTADPFAGGRSNEIDRQIAAALRSYAGELESANCTKGYSFSTGWVTIEPGWSEAIANGSFCGLAPLGQPWNVSGAFVQHTPEGTIPTPGAGTFTFDAAGKKAAVTGDLWFVLDINLLLTEDPPMARVWLWNGQFIRQQEVTVPLVADANCQPTG
jgi:hypothetical protein